MAKSPVKITVQGIKYGLPWRFMAYACNRLKGCSEGGTSIGFIKFGQQFSGIPDPLLASMWKTKSRVSQWFSPSSYKRGQGRTFALYYDGPVIITSSPASGESDRSCLTQWKQVASRKSDKLVTAVHIPSPGVDSKVRKSTPM